ncbi:hypothetical protein Gogos_022236 [Gossypium gossypioides]|uniref:Uncharacterized protein n=1 Tax=Gossypium gossypioides TaxID=34282 RepID=A0A7J9D3W4_GOSGO|nr:hypothetical protein [Gossypium gossypioides]
MVVGAPLAQGAITRADGLVGLPRCLPFLSGNGDGADATGCCAIVMNVLGSLCGVGSNCVIHYRAWLWIVFSYVLVDLLATLDDLIR